jgi:hypothetical protein
MAQEPPQDKGRPQKQQLTAQGQNAQGGASAIAQTLVAMLAVLKIIGRRQDKERPSWAQRQR